MQSKVLIGYDDSSEGDDALVLGHRLSEILDARPVVTFVIAHPQHDTDKREFDEAVDRFCEPIFAKARERLDGLAPFSRLVAETTLPDPVADRVVLHTPAPVAGDDELDRSLRPKALEEFVGVPLLRSLRDIAISPQVSIYVTDDIAAGSTTCAASSASLSRSP